MQPDYKAPGPMTQPPDHRQNAMSKGVTGMMHVGAIVGGLTSNGDPNAAPTGGKVEPVSTEGEGGSYPSHMLRRAGRRH